MATLALERTRDATGVSAANKRSTIAVIANGAPRAMVELARMNCRRLQACAFMGKSFSRQQTRKVSVIQSCILGLLGLQLLCRRCSVTQHLRIVYGRTCDFSAKTHRAE